MNTRKGYFIAGTDTGVGKTFVTALLAALVKQQFGDVGVMKPIETGFAPGVSDAEFLSAAVGANDPPEEICPARYMTPAAPYLAASMEKRPIKIPKILAAYKKLAARHDTVFVEGLGGLMVPIKPDYLAAHLARDIELPVLVVSRLALGTINHTLLTLEAAKKFNLNVKGILFNQTRPGELDAVQKLNPDIVRQFTDVPVLGVLPHVENLSPEIFKGKRLDKLKNHLDWQSLF